MTRPTREEVDEALRDIAGDESDLAAADWAIRGAAVLAAEVVALREELASAKLLNETQLLGSIKVREDLEAARALAALHAADARKTHEELAAAAARSWDANRELCALESQPRYSTEAVDALLNDFDALDAAIDAARASREPRKA
jgi:hypothetical protein